MTPAQPHLQTISASFVAPVCAPPIADGILSFAAGQITYVGPADGRRIDQRFDDVVLLPGLVNTHTHLDLTGALGLVPPQRDFCSWLTSVVAYRQARTDKQVQADITSGVRQCIEAGTTLVGDIALAAYDYGPLNVVAFQELIGLSKTRCKAALHAWHTQSNPLDGVSPHAPYSFRFDQLGNLPKDKRLAMHLAETKDELELLANRSGPMKQFLCNIGAWDDTGIAPSIDAILDVLHARNGPTLLIHCNYLPVTTPIPRRATIVYCPRTHEAFGHDPHRYRDFLARGHRVVLGTDSLASNPDLSLLNEARFIYHQFGDADALLRMVTASAAEALGWGHRHGKLAPGYAANMCAVGIPPRSTQPLSDLFGSCEPVRAVFISGNRLV